MGEWRGITNIEEEKNEYSSIFMFIALQFIYTTPRVERVRVGCRLTLFSFRSGSYGEELYINKIYKGLYFFYFDFCVGGM